MTSNMASVQMFSLLLLLSITACNGQWNDHYDEEDDEYVLPIVLPIVAVVLIACIGACCWQGGKCPCSKKNKDKKKNKDLEKGEKGSALEAARNEDKVPPKNSGVKRPHQISDVQTDPAKRNKSLPPTPDDIPPPYHLAATMQSHPSSNMKELPGRSRRVTEQYETSRQNPSRVRSQQSRRHSTRNNKDYSSKGSTRGTSSRRNDVVPRTRSSRRGSGEYRGRSNEGYTYQENRRSHRSSRQFDY